jgi:hypothetical protein
MGDNVRLTPSQVKSKPLYLVVGLHMKYYMLRKYSCLQKVIR